MGFVRTAVLAGAAAVWASGAWAANLSYQGAWAGSYSNVGYTVTDPSQSRNNNQPAGAFKMSQVTSGALGYGIPDTFAAFCLDLVGTISSGGFVVNNVNPYQTARVLSDEVKERVENLYDASFGSVDLLNKNQSAAFQLALWEVAYEPDGATITLGAGNFKDQNTSTAIRELADQYLANLGNAFTKKYNVFFLDADDLSNQDLVTATVVPLPAAGLLLIGGLGALAMVRRRREAATA
jgi:hypothetical protein